MAAGMCRLCASENESLISMVYQWENISQKLSVCCGIHIEVDDTTLPQSICQECMGCLNASYKFYIQVQDAQQTLQSYFSRPQRYTDKTNIMHKPFKDTLGTNLTRKKIDGNICEPKVLLTKPSRRRVRKAPISFNKRYLENNRLVEKEPLFTIANVTSLVSNNDLSDEYILPEDTSIKKDLQNDPLHKMDDNDIEQYRKETYITLPKVKKEPTEIQEYDAENEDISIEKDMVVLEIKKEFCSIQPERQITTWTSYIHLCYVCEYRASDFQDLIRHVDIMHSVRDFNEFQYKCSDCKQIFIMYNAFLSHVRLKHHPALKLRCDACDVPCPDFNSYIVHRNIICSERNKYPCNLPQNTQKGQLLRKIYKCTTCNKEFLQKRSLKNHKHIRQRKKYTIPGTKYHCSICNKEFTQLRGLRSHQSNHMKEQEVICDYCGEVFSSIHSLELHLPIHALDTEFKCHICQKSFTKFSLLEKHKKNVHNEIKKFKCSICSRSFRTKIEKITHEGDQHADEMPFSCKHCDRRFRWSCQLDVHLAVHSNDRKYTCTFCNKSVKDMYYFKRHEKTCWARAEEYTKTVERESTIH